jgi:hypothetical protein
MLDIIVLIAPLIILKTRAEELDRRFDKGVSVIEFLDVSKIAKSAHNMSRRVNVDMPVGMIADLGKRGVTRQALMKMWQADRLESAAWGKFRDLRTCHRNPRNSSHRIHLL